MAVPLLYAIPLLNPVQLVGNFMCQYPLVSALANSVTPQVNKIPEAVSKDIPAAFGATSDAPPLKMSAYPLSPTCMLGQEIGVAGYIFPPLKAIPGKAVETFDV